MKITKNCEICNKQMENVYHTKKYCNDCIPSESEEMRKVYHQRRGDRKDYKKAYRIKNGELIREKYHRKHHKEITCSNCGVSFMQTNTIQKFCSIGCMKSFHYKLNKERYNADGRLNYHLNKDKISKKNREYRLKLKLKENERRKLLGLPLVGEGFRRETEMFVYLNHLFSGEQIVFHDRVELNGLELDAYLPSLKLAFEYMGRQHFEETYINGSSMYIQTEEALKAQKYRDSIKKERCREKGITLIYINFNEKLSEQLIIQKLNSVGVGCIQKNLHISSMWRPRK